MIRNLITHLPYAFCLIRHKGSHYFHRPRYGQRKNSKKKIHDIHTRFGYSHKIWNWAWLSKALEWHILRNTLSRCNIFIGAFASMMLIIEAMSRKGFDQSVHWTLQIDCTDRCTCKFNTLWLKKAADTFYQLRRKLFSLWLLYTCRRYKRLHKTS